MTSDDRRCGYAVTDRDGVEEPCDRPATGWRWYQDVGEHEDLLDVACDWHANEGGRRIAELEAQLRAARSALAACREVREARCGARTGGGVCAMPSGHDGGHGQVGLR